MLFGHSTFCKQFSSGSNVHNSIVNIINYRLSSEEECEGNAFGSACLFVCLRVRVRNSKTIALIDLIFYPRSGSVLLEDDAARDLDSRIYLKMLHNCEIGQTMTS